ncbi:MAG: VWA domain-containing protein [Blastocatellia bacterium]|nr:VWA domain-containing protein [Blastocatellia bacterium]
MKLFVANLVLLAIFACAASAQSRRSAAANDGEGTTLNITVKREGNKTDLLALDRLSLFENGNEQKISSLTYDASPSRIVLLIDNSQTIGANVEALKKAVMEFAYEIFEGDQIFVLAYDTTPEIIQEWTDDAKKIEASLGTLRKKGNPYLFDALDATVTQVLAPLMPGTRKTAIVVVTDGLDRGSKRSFDFALNQLQSQNVTLYALQLPDRTGGAYRRNQPKPPQVATQLVEASGGLIFPFEEAQSAAKIICEELRKNRYLIAYNPTNTSSFDERRLLVVGEAGMTIRAKAAQPPNVK